VPHRLHERTDAVTTRIDRGRATRPDAVYAGGRWHAPASSGRIDVQNPYDLTIVGSAPDGAAADVDVAVRAAREAFDHGPWPRLTRDERAAWLRASRS
jgi:aldehyde dehydrogenase (NAD+)